MNRALLCCNAVDRELNSFHYIWSLDKLTEIQLASQGVSSTNLCDVDLPDIDAHIRGIVERGLRTEARRGGRYSWAEIAFQHVYWKFLYYYQYRLRLSALIKQEGITHLTVSSQANKELLHASEAACNELGVQLEKRHGAANSPSSLLPFLSSYDLPDVSDFEIAFSSLLAFLYRQRQTHIFYQPYNNLASSYPGSAVITWRRSLCFPGFHLPRMQLGLQRPIINIENTIRLVSDYDFDAQSWPGLDSYDMQVIASAFSYFCERYDVQAVSRLYEGTRRFFRQSRVKRLVLNSDNTCTSRLLAKAARHEQIDIDFMPHGLVWEDLTLETQADCNADRVLAWNQTSVAAYRWRGIRAKAVAHPSCAGKTTRKRVLGKDCSALRVLVMPPEWVGLSFASRPDCFENDLVDISQALRELGIEKIHIKLHNSTPFVVEAKMNMLKAIQPYAGIEFVVLDSSLPAVSLYEIFDLVIIGPTTGLLEASRSSAPFVGFRALMHKAGTLTGAGLPHANTVNELKECITSFDAVRVTDQCYALGKTLQEGEPPFLMS